MEMHDWCYRAIEKMMIAEGLHRTWKSYLRFRENYPEAVPSINASCGAAEARNRAEIVENEACRILVNEGMESPSNLLKGNGNAT